ncbi:major facilitator superfamily domain-containing protein [Phycomyces nitens]|nr:major facilitator superfamily domain-containing protein [Phycomyces nitens]
MAKIQRGSCEMEMKMVNNDHDNFQSTEIDQDRYNFGYDYSDDSIISIEEKTLVRKIDLFVMPIICIIDFIQYLDKATINYAGVFGIQKDLNLQGTEFSFLGSIFYLGFLIFQLPNNYFLQRLPLSRYIGTLVLLWGTSLWCTAFATNFSQAAALRFLLGLFEAGIYPCLTLLISTFYRRSEQITRLSAFWIFNGLGFIVGGFITYGIGRMENLHGIAQWKWIMFILGGLTCLIGIAVFFFLIDHPKSPYLNLNAEQEILVEERMRDNAVMRTRNIKKEHIFEALKDVRCWCFCFACTLLNLQNGGMTVYSSQITVAFGYTPIEAVLSTVGIGAADIVYIIVAVYFVKKTNQTIYVACVTMFINNVGLLLLLVIPVPKLKLIGLYLGWTYPAAYVLILTSITNNISGYTKKIFFNGLFMVFYTIGNFAGPYIANSSPAPQYLGAMIGYIVANFGVIGFLLLARWRMAIVNERRLSQPSTMATNVEDDLTDVQDPNFIYRL